MSKAGVSEILIVATLRIQTKFALGWLWNFRCPVRFYEPVICKLEATMGRGILLWLLGVPIPVIILLWLFFR